MGVCGVQVCVCGVCDVEVMVSHSKGIAAIIIRSHLGGVL